LKLADEIILDINNFGDEVLLPGGSLAEHLSDSLKFDTVALAVGAFEAGLAIEIVAGERAMLTLGAETHPADLIPAITVQVLRFLDVKSAEHGLHLGIVASGFNLHLTYDYSKYRLNYDFYLRLINKRRQ
jgi:hypothetical protein